ncbi:peptidoglycan editing factor PgeF [Oceanobacillus sp. ISL-73]|uniref:peptidoglycan editing factor PgeF n=1 Tax=Oceanobacillus TaxID=182709 RepID=UPI00084E490B|nr:MULTISPECIES: peptidoglycan editing factor PgeF [Oceanobacillus]MBT2598789.1 peptidoglycan editing factor PgeF [Oceanobacillus sp. ISL-74]MBT2651708.1 peptidoglycan editing factor PgeF [Oceanobacillus sp. ISL-73]
MRVKDIFIQKEASYFHVEEWEREYPGLLVGFTTKNGGTSIDEYSSLNMGFHVNDDESNVLQNRKVLSNQLQVNLSNWVAGEQVHDTKVALIQPKDVGCGSNTNKTSLSGVDGLIIPANVNALAVSLYADCVPLYFFDPVTKFVGIAHAGWKGTVGRIATEMVQSFVNLGSDKKNIKVIIGPSISVENYQVDLNVIEHLTETEMQICTKQVSDNQFLLDLKELNREILLQSGIFRHNIEVTKYCTYRDETLFFSHRRDKGKTGRMLGFIGYNV